MHGSGTTLADLPGNNNTGAPITGATWKHFREIWLAQLSFNGTSNLVSIANSSSLDTDHRTDA